MKHMSYLLVSLLSGMLFGVGLTISQMINPNKVTGFLDILGDWDPSLSFVMIGALCVTFISFRWVLKRPKAVCGTDFHISKRTQLDKALLGGAAIFGIGWGVSGYCPGPAVASLGLGSVEALVSVVSIFAGFFFQKWLSKII